MLSGLFPWKSLAVAVALVALLAGVLAAGGQADPHPIAVQVKSELKDPTKPFTMIVRLQVKEGEQEKFEAAFAKAVKATRKEKGCVAYDLSREAKDPTRYILYERWKSLADLDAHLKTPHITTLLAELKEMLAAPPEARVMLPASERAD
jgi:quinol monooxygenase YgiN